MSTQVIDQAITELSSQIALRQNAIQSLQALKDGPPMPAPDDREPQPIKPNGPRRPYKKRAPAPTCERRTKPVSQERPIAGSVLAKLDKPDTLAGAFKQCIRQRKDAFNFDDLKTMMLADPDFAKLFNDASNPMSTVTYWVKAGKLSNVNGQLTVSDKEFFGL